MTALIWHPEKLVHYPLIEHVHVSPLGDAVLYTVRRAHMTDDASEFRQQIYRVAAHENASPRPLTTGIGATAPKWSPDGKTIAFLRKLPDNKMTGLWLMDAHGGEPWPLLPPSDAPAAHHESILQFEWRPDGRAIAFTAVPTDQERRRRVRQKDDVTCWRVDYDFAHLFIVELDAQPPESGSMETGHATWRRLTQGQYHVDAFAWHPRGNRLAFHAQDTPHIDSWTTSRLMTVETTAAHAVPEKIADVQGWSLAVAYSPDGAWLACQKGIDDNHWPYAGRMHIYATADSATADAGAGSTGAAGRALADVSDAQPTLIGWTPDSQAVLVLDNQGLGTAILALPIDGGPPRTVVDAHGPTAVAHIGASGLVAFVQQDHDTLNGIAITPVDEPEIRRIATPAAADYPAGPLPQVQELRWTTADGVEIEGILYLPAGYDPASDPTAGRKLPLLLHIHGGPMGVFQRAYAATPYYYTPAALCELGCAVLRANPRGSGGYGKDFRFANMHDWGGGDYQDLMQGVDTVLEMGIADPDRLGVCGWSYGGFMSSWIITQTHRFQAASIGAPLTNAMSFNATADIPGFVPDYYGGEAWEIEDFYRERSPVFHAHHVRTPAIIQHGADDLRVPLEQGLQYYHVLKRNNVPAELYIYPRQGHAILEPRLLIDAIQRNLDWFTQRLGLEMSRPSNS